MKWISVSDKKPEFPNNRVLVYSRFKDHEIEYDKFDQAYYIPEHDYFCIGSDVCETWKVQYWMPFPNQPERLNEKTSKEDAIV